MFNAIAAIFKELTDSQRLRNQHDQPDLAIACLLTEVVYADHEVTPSEIKARPRLLQKLCRLDEETVKTLLTQADQLVQESASLYDFTSQLRSLSHQKRFDLIQAMWEIAQADGYIDPLEDAVIRKTAELLYVDHSEFIRAKIIVADHLATDSL